MDCLITPVDRIFVAGHRGMAGSAICRALQRAGYTNLLTATRAELDLEDGPAVQRWFAEHQPSVVVRIDPRYFRPAEVETLLGDPSKAREKLGWTTTTTLEQLVAEMVAADREEARKEAILRLKGFNVVGSMES